MKIVVLDGGTLSQGDIDLAPLLVLGNVNFYERTSAEQVVERTHDADVVLTNKTPVTEAQMAEMKNLKFISVLATGHNIVDSAAARQRGIAVSNVPAYSTMSVAQLTFALILELTHHVGYHDATVHEGRWAECPDFSYWDYPLCELDGKILGIVGLGAIGSRVAQIGHAFGMKVMATNPSPRNQPGVQQVELDLLLESSDVVSMHCPLTPETTGMINAFTLARMQSTAFFVNTSRGGLVVESHLAAALQEGKLGGAAIDVLTQEPPRADNPLLEAPNCFITPHIAWASIAARRRLLNETAENVRAFLGGKPRNVVNGLA